MTTDLPMQIIEHRDLNAREARAITERIKSAMGDLMIEVARAWIGRVWLVLGYESWLDYIKGEFSEAPLFLPQDQRRAVASLLRSQGMSTRAIGAVTGVHHDTIASDLATVGNPTVNEPVQVTGLDGRIRNYSVTCPQPGTAQPAPSQDTVTCPTCGGTGRITK